MKSFSLFLALLSGVLIAPFILKASEFIDQSYVLNESHISYDSSFLQDRESIISEVNLFFNEIHSDLSLEDQITVDKLLGELKKTKDENEFYDILKQINIIFGVTITNQADYDFLLQKYESIIFFQELLNSSTVISEQQKNQIKIALNDLYQIQDSLSFFKQVDEIYSLMEDEIVIQNNLDFSQIKLRLIQDITELSTIAISKKQLNSDLIYNSIQELNDINNKGLFFEKNRTDLYFIKY